MLLRKPILPRTEVTNYTQIGGLPLLSVVGRILLVPSANRRAGIKPHCASSYGLFSDGARFFKARTLPAKQSTIPVISNVCSRSPSNATDKSSATIGIAAPV